MKRKLLFTLLLISTIFTTQSFGQGYLIHYWHFNNLTLVDTTSASMPSIGPINADNSAIDVTKATIWYYQSTFVDTTRADFYLAVAGDYDTMNLRMGAVSGNALRLRNPSNNMEVRIYLPSTNYNNLALKFGTEGSSRTSGMLLQNYDYSTDSGATWKTTGLSMTSDSAGVWIGGGATINPVFSLVSLNFGTDATVNNNPKLVFRIKFSGNADTLSTSSGNNRFDNVTLDGDAISHVSVPVVVSAETSYTLYPNPVSTTLNLTSDIAGTKTVMIHDLAGKTVFAGLADGKDFSLNVADLQSGMYFISIRENNTGRVNNMKFIKQ